jgi:hypothetical protein
MQQGVLEINISWVKVESIKHLLCIHEPLPNTWLVFTMRLGSKRCIYVGVLDDNGFFYKETVFVTKVVIRRCKKW